MTSPFHAPIAEQIWDAKYRFKEADGTPIDQTVEDTWRRIAEALTANETSNMAPVMGLVKAPKACPNCHGYSFKVESGCEVCVDCGHSKCG